MIDEFAPLVDSMLRTEILMKAVVTHERLARESGFTDNYQRTKFYVQEARSLSAASASPRQLVT
ncbi:hypothetical protein ACWCQZ_46125 [Streptomyces sp. NPDC002285]